MEIKCKMDGFIGYTFEMTEWAVARESLVEAIKSNFTQKLARYERPWNSTKYSNYIHQPSSLMENHFFFLYGLALNL